VQFTTAICKFPCKTWLQGSKKDAAVSSRVYVCTDTDIHQGTIVVPAQSNDAETQVADLR
jgi:hypothetical protein